MSPLAAALLKKIESRDRPDRRRRARICRSAARGRTRTSPGSTPPVSTSTIGRSRRSRRALLHPRRDDRDVMAFTKAGKLDATADFAVVKELDTINICVPTPLRKTKDPDMSYIVSAVEAIAKYLHPGHAHRARIDDLSGDDGRSGAADARGDRPQGRRRFLPRVLARARRSRQPELPDAQRAQGGRRVDAGLFAARRRALRHARSRPSSRSARRESPRW